MVVLDNSIIQDFEQICSTFLKIFKLYLLDTPTFIIEPFISLEIKRFKIQAEMITDCPRSPMKNRGLFGMTFDLT